MTGGDLDRRYAASKQPVNQDWLNSHAFAYPGANPGAASRAPEISAKPTTSQTTQPTGAQSPKDINGASHGGVMSLDDVLRAALTGEGKCPGDKPVDDGGSKWITPNEGPH